MAVQKCKQTTEHFKAGKLSKKTMENTSSVEVIVDGIENNPHCFHGPTILFRKHDKTLTEYYACSACRDRKDCSFYLKKSEALKGIGRSSKWKQLQYETLQKFKKENRYEKFKKILKSLQMQQMNCISNDSNDTRKSFGHNESTNIFKQLEKDKKLNSKKHSTKAPKRCMVKYCCTCNILIEDSETGHLDCGVIENLTEHQLTHPTEILIPKEDSKTNAQYFFSQSTVEVIVSLVKKLNVERILCIGTPRIHEFVLNKHKNDMKSLLLDIDQNFYNFYSEEEFIWYNMFNNHIFDAEQAMLLPEFLKTQRLVVLMDPPFGGRVEPLANTLNKLNEVYKQVNNLPDNNDDGGLEVLWFFPYFMEHHIQSSLPNFKMFDFKVDYENHSSFTNVGSRKRKFGSPVRIFTNIPLGRLDLTDVPGYKFCKKCEFWVAEENQHCKHCNACTSKNGRTYIHCQKCARCVKPSYKHCDTCERCCLSTHICGQLVPEFICYHCHNLGHKKKDCPDSTIPAKKRKIDKTEEKFNSKKK